MEKMKERSGQGRIKKEKRQKNLNENVCCQVEQRMEQYVKGTY